MARTNRIEFLDDCEECGAPLTLISNGRVTEMYCKKCGFTEQPRVKHSWREDRRKKFRMGDRQEELL